MSYETHLARLRAFSHVITCASSHQPRNLSQPGLPNTSIHIFNLTIYLQCLSNAKISNKPTDSKLNLILSVILPTQNKIQEAGVTFFFNTGRNLKAYCSMRNWGCLLKNNLVLQEIFLKNRDFLAFPCHTIRIASDEFWTQSQETGLCVK